MLCIYLTKTESVCEHSAKIGSSSLCSVYRTTHTFSGSVSDFKAEPVVKGRTWTETCSGPHTPAHSLFFSPERLLVIVNIYPVLC